jgi:hypothetical protein
MGLPVPANTTCDIYRGGTGPPAAPAVAGVACYLSVDYERRMETGESMSTTLRYTHVMLVDVSVDIRDGMSNYSNTSGNCDLVYVPDKNGTKFQVNFVERHNRGNLQVDHKRVFLDRALPTWPTNNI